jgi:hypothetical protein
LDPDGAGAASPDGRASATGRPGGSAPPPEGIDLIVQKMSIDHPARPHEDRPFEHWRDDTLRFDELADAVRPHRDHDGKVVVDLKHALIGAVVVAVICGLVYYRLAQVVPLPGS